MNNFNSLSDNELIQKHKEQWIQWVKMRRRFGEMGATSGPFELEKEARRRNISDSLLMESIPMEYK